MNDQRRLSDAEVSLVLQRAAEVSESSGLTVAQVREIARDVGLSSDAVSRALQESASGALKPASLEKIVGVPTAVAKDVALGGTLTDDGWRVLVSTLRATFGATGKESRDGVVREWRNGNLRIAIESTATGDRLRMSTRRRGAFQGPIIGSVALLMSAASTGAFVSGRPMLTLAAGIPALIGAALMATPFLTLPRWARSRSAQFDLVAREAARLAEANTRPALTTGDQATPV
jgi:hypothetical protein